MVFVKTDAFNVVPRSRLMAEEALADLGFFHARSLHGDHFEVHHVVARRCLMALRAGSRCGGRMAKLRDRPLRSRMA